MEYLRTCYTARMKFSPDSDVTFPIQWYFVPDDRPVVPFEHAFGSRQYDLDEPEPAIGERFEPRKWHGGQSPLPETRCGLCGDKTQWLEGLKSTDPPAAVWPGTNVPRCCCRPVQEGNGGLAWGNTAPPPMVCCAGADIPLIVNVTFNMGTGSCGSFSMTMQPFSWPTDEPAALADRPPTWQSGTVDVNGQAVNFYAGCDPTTSRYYLAATTADGVTLHFAQQLTTLTCAPPVGIGLATFDFIELLTFTIGPCVYVPPPFGIIQIAGPF